MIRVVVLSLLLAAPLFAAAPPRVPVQGFLTDDGGAPISGTLPLAIALYDVDSGGTPFFTETQSVSIVGGLFSLEIGAQSVLDLLEFRDRDRVFLGISVDADPELSPRIPLATVPWAAYASFAGDAETLQGLSPDDFRRSADAIPYDQVTGVPPDILDGDDNTDTLAALSCSNGQVPRRFGAAWLCDEAVRDVGCAAGLVLAGFDSAGAPVCVPGTDEATVDAFVANNGFAVTNIGCPAGQVMRGINANGTPSCVIDQNTIPTGADFALSGQSCPPGQVMTGINASGNVLCRTLDTLMRDYVNNNCNLYVAWRDGCDDCTTFTKAGRVTQAACTNILGGDNTCQQQSLGGDTIRTFGLNFDGDVDGNDKLYIGMRCF